MIWLVKTREKAISDGIKGSYSYVKDCMESADTIIKKIKPSKITDIIRNDANYYLYQLMEVYVTCKIVTKWLSFDTDKEKEAFFYNFKDSNYLKEVCNFFDFYCSSFEYESFSESMKSTINLLFNENIEDFKRAFQKCLEQ